MYKCIQNKYMRVNICILYTCFICLYHMENDLYMYISYMYTYYYGILVFHKVFFVGAYLAVAFSFICSLGSLLAMLRNDIKC